jgi:hypothetical protein
LYCIWQLILIHTFIILSATYKKLMLALFFISSIHPKDRVLLLEVWDWDAVGRGISLPFIPFLFSISSHSPSFKKSIARERKRAKEKKRVKERWSLRLPISHFSLFRSFPLLYFFPFPLFQQKLLLTREKE